MDPDVTSPLAKATFALHTAGLHALADALERANAIPGLYLLTGQALAGKSTAIRSAFGVVAENAGVKPPDHPWKLDMVYEFEFEGTRPDQPKKAGLTFGFGGEPEYATPFPELFVACHATSSDIVLADSFKNLPLFDVQPEEDIDDNVRANNDHSQLVGAYRFKRSDAIWSGGVTTSTVITIETVSRAFLEKERYVIAAFNPLLAESEAYYKLLAGSCSGVIRYTGSEFTITARRDVTVPSATESLRFSDGYGQEDTLSSIATEKFLTPVGDD